MDINIGTAISGAVFITLCIIPFMMMSRNRKKKEKAFLAKLGEMATQHHAQIDEYGIAATFAIGLDKAQQRVFFYQQTKEKSNQQSIDLRSVQACKMVSTNRKVKNNGTDQNVIEKLELVFTPRKEGQAPIRLKCFNKQQSLQLYGELQLAQQWASIITQQLSKLPQ